MKTIHYFWSEDKKSFTVIVDDGAGTQVGISLTPEEAKKLADAIDNPEPFFGG